MRATEMLARAMELRGVNQAQLAERLGVRPSFVSEVLRGERNITLRTLARFLDALDCDVDTKEEPREQSAQMREQSARMRDYCVVGPRLEVPLAHLYEHFSQFVDHYALDISRYAWAVSDIGGTSGFDPFHDDPYEDIEEVRPATIRQASVAS